MSKHSNITTRRYMVPFILVTTLFFLWGFARAILDVLNKYFQETLSIGITESAWIQVVTYLGYFLMAIPAGMFISRWGYRKGVVFGLMLFALGAFMFIPSARLGTFNAFLLCLFIIACGLVFLETSANPYATLLGPRETATSRLNLSQSFNGMGNFLAPLVIGRFLFDTSDASGQVDVSLPYMVMGIAVACIAVVFAFIKLPEVAPLAQSTSDGHIVADLDTDDGPGRTARQRFASFMRAANRSPYLDSGKGRGATFFWGLLALLCYEISEISINSYFLNFTTGMGFLTSANASYVLSLALVIFMVGRFVGSALMLLISAERMLLICACGSIVCMAGVLACGFLCDETLSLGWLCLTFLISNYFFESIMFRTIFSMAFRGLGHHTKTGSSLLMMTPVGGCGFLLVAWIAESTMPVMPFFLPLFGFMIVALYAWRSVVASHCRVAA